VIAWLYHGGSDVLLSITGYISNIILACINVLLLFGLNKALIGMKTLWSHIWRTRLKIYQRLWVKGYMFLNSDLGHDEVMKFYEDFLEARGNIFFCSEDIRDIWFKLKSAYEEGDHERTKKLINVLLETIEKEVG